MGSSGINLNYVQAYGAMAEDQRAAPPVIALDAMNSSLSASMFASDRVPWKYESYERLAAEGIGVEVFTNLLHSIKHFCSFSKRRNKRFA